MKDDTAKQRARGQIAADAGEDVGKMKAGLITSRPQRKHSLLPNVQDANSLSQTAGTLDQFNMNQNAAMQITDMLNKMPPEMAAQFMQMVQQMQQQAQDSDIDDFLDSLPDEELAKLQQLPPEQRDAAVKQMMMGGTA